MYSLLTCVSLLNMGGLQTMRTKWFLQDTMKETSEHNAYLMNYYAPDIQDGVPNGCALSYMLLGFSITY